MFSFFKKIFAKKKTNQNPNSNSAINPQKLSTSLNKNMEKLNPYIDRNLDINKRPFILNGSNNINGVVIYIQGIADQKFLQHDVLTPLMHDSNIDDFNKKGMNYLIDLLYKSSLTISNAKIINDASLLLQSIFDGLVIVMVDGYAEVLTIDINGSEHRGIEEPPTERTLRGSREGFIEDLIVNISMVRKRLPDPNLVIEKTKVGRRTRTDVAILFIEDIADPKIVQDIRNKINQIDIDGITAVGYIEQFIEDNPYSVFPQIRSIDRPDKVVPELLEGRVAIMAAGTPSVLIIPSLFISFLQASEDYYDRTYVSSYNRISRYLAFVLSISLPPLYIALLSFQPELIPFQLLVSFAEAREKVPFPVVVEVLIQEMIIQLVVEAGLRLPVTIGQTVGVVAGIVLGQAAISANLASPAIIIVVAITTIATYSLPNYSMVLATRLLRILMLVATSLFGLFGFSLGWLLILAHLASLESMGVPYLSPIAPTRFKDLKDAQIRTFLDSLTTRPKSIPHKDNRRQGGKNKNGR